VLFVAVSFSNSYGVFGFRLRVYRAIYFELFLGCDCEMLEAVLGGTAASHACSGVGGGTFLIKKLGESRESRAGNLRRRRGIEPKTRPFVLRPGRSVAAASPVARASFGILFRFQVADFDLLFGFFSLCHFPFLLSLVSFRYVEVFENCSGEEQPSFIPARVSGAVIL
jgi:hypothetical protein